MNTKYDGWIEKVYINYVGQPVKKGQKLFEIYSPQLVTTQQEYLDALDYAENLSTSPYPASKNGPGPCWDPPVSGSPTGTFRTIRLQNWRRPGNFFAP